MTRLLAFLCFLSFTLPTYGQELLKGRVTDENGSGLPFVNITINGGRQGLSSDLDGYFEIPSAERLQSLHFSYIGFESKVIEGQDLRKNPLQVVLIEKATSLEEVTVLPGENPAHRMIENAVRNKKLNDPNKLESFSYFSYSKFMITFDLDSIDPKIDTLMLSDRLDSLQRDTLQTDSIWRIDSSGYNMHEFFSQRHLFFMETLTERKVRKPRDNEKVLAQRTSGFKNPMFALLVTQLQSFSFYEDFIGISGDEYLNPISKGSTNRYFFLIEDSVFTEEGDTIFTISFRPKPNKVFKALQGVISIDSRDWAIRNVRAKPALKEGTQIEIRQEYKKYGPHTWFPISFEADIDPKFISVNGSAPQALMRRKLMRINLKPDLEDESIPRVELSIEEKDQEEVDSLLAVFRTEALDSLETSTYQFIDSLSEAENIERNLQLLVTLSRGYVPIGIFNLDIGEILKYNVYEGTRLGLDLETNDKLVDWFSVGAYGAYGFKDKAWKYGGRFQLDLHKNSRWELYGEYQHEIFETSAFGIPFSNSRSLVQDNYHRLYIEQWDMVDRLRGGMRLDPFPNLRVDLGINEERLRTLGDYQFEGEAPQSFRFTEMYFGLRYAPDEQYAETPFGKIRIKEASPVFRAHYSRGSDQIASGNFNYHRLVVDAEYNRLSRGYGQTTIGLRMGKTWGEVPATKLFTPVANFRNVNSFWAANLGSISDRNAFETMRFNEFLNDELLTLMWRQDFRSTLFKIGKLQPHFEMVHRLALGRLTRPELHQNIGTKSLTKPYFESGFELNKLYNFGFAGLGLGVYYRYGANRFSNELDNFAFKLTSKFSF